MKIFYFVRHGQTEWNAIARMQGQMNSQLNAHGREQAAAHGRLLANAALDAMIVSPLDRARETAEIVRRFVDLDVRYDDRIKEWDCGVWSGQLRADVKKRWPREWAALTADPYHYRGPRCENYPDMIARVRPFLDELVASKARTVAVISHGMIGRVMVGLLMGFGEQQMLGYKQPNDVVYRVTSADDGGNRSASYVLEHFIGGDGPFAGVVPRN